MLKYFSPTAKLQRYATSIADRMANIPPGQEGREDVMLDLAGRVAVRAETLGLGHLNDAAGLGAEGAQNDLGAYYRLIGLARGIGEPTLNGVVQQPEVPDPIVQMHPAA